MIEVRITYYPPVSLQDRHGSLSIEECVPIQKLRLSDVGAVGEVAERLYQIIRENSMALQGELE